MRGVAILGNGFDNGRFPKIRTDPYRDGERERMMSGDYRMWTWGTIF